MAAANPGDIPVPGDETPITDNTTPDVIIDVPPLTETEQQKIIEESGASLLSSSSDLPDIGTQLTNILFSFPNCQQGWKVFCLISWTGGVLTQFSYELEDLTPMNPLLTQSNTQ